MSLIIDWLFPRSCLGCGKGNKYLCNLCEMRQKNGDLIEKDGFEGIISIYKYDDLVRTIIEKIKYEFVSDAIFEMAEYMSKKIKLNYPNILKYWQKEGYCLVPIPLFNQREKWRGFNQSEILALNLSKILNLDYKNDVLVRNVKIKNQAEIKNRQEKWKNISDVFGIVPSMKVPKKAIIVDDVVTSGATMTEALRILKMSGANSGWGLSLGGVQK